MLRLRTITVHPVKALRGFEAAEWRVGRRGLEGDRRWMLVDRDGCFVTQRKIPGLARVAASFEGDELRLRGRSELAVPRVLGSGRERSVTVWSSTVRAIAYEPAREWLRSELGLELELVYMPDDSERAVDAKYGAPGDVVSFADGYPVLVANQASLDDLNARLETPASMRQFRPNLVVEGAGPWAEDAWGRVRVGGVTLRVVKPCDRCSVVTIDPDAESPAARREPLATLATFRARENKVYFGQNAVPETDGTLRVGDEVVVV